MRMRRLCHASVVLAISALSVNVAVGANFSFQGTFQFDDQLEIFKFVASSPSAIIQTLSYGSGIDAAGDAIPPGGFDPYLSLFDSTGGFLTAATPLLNTNDNGTCPPLTTDNGNCFDSFLDTAAAPVTILTPGNTYFVVLSQSGNTPAGADFGAGFTETGNPNFTAPNGCTNGIFCDFDTTNRNGSWEVDILGVTSAVDTTIPEPGSGPLLATAFAAALALWGRRKAGYARQVSQSRHGH